MTGKKPSSRNGRLRESSAGADGGHAAFLPVSRGDMESRGWGELDFLFVSGDAYVDHPSFAAALICRSEEQRLNSSH